jgi:hypothetical protein
MAGLPRLARASIVGLVALSCGLGWASPAFAQAAPPPPSGQAAQSGQAFVPPPMLRVFLDCNQCDETYVRQNVEFVDYVRDRAVADVHVLVTTRGTGSGGTEWTVKVIGLAHYQQVDRTITFSTPQTATSDDQRREFTKFFKQAMAGYAADTAAARNIDVTYTPATAAAGPAAVPRDRWNFWVFRTNVNGNVNGERSSTSKSFRGSFSANRVTEQWKISINNSANVSQSRFELSDDTTIRSRSDSWNSNALVVKSLGPKWSIGGRVSANHSSFSNTDLSVGGTAGLEYDIFPYAESARRSFTLRYQAGATSYRYRRVTLFDRLEETVPSHSVDASLGLRQPWGSINSYTSVAQHLNRRDRTRFVTYGNADIRLFKGFSFDIFAEYNKINDQIGLPKSGASTEEILLRLQQLSTSYSYFFSVGFSYSFGSIFNSVVNPRFNGLGIF